MLFLLQGMHQLLVTNAERLSAQLNVWTNMNEQMLLQENFRVYPDLNKQPKCPEMYQLQLSVKYFSKKVIREKIKVTIWCNLKVNSVHKRRTVDIFTVNHDKSCSRASASTVVWRLIYINHNDVARWHATCSTQLALLSLLQQILHCNDQKQYNPNHFFYFPNSLN